MIAELGTLSLVIALCLALAQGLFPLIGIQKSYGHFVVLTRSLATGQFVFITLAFACLIYLFVENDFSVAYVVANSNSKLPLVYRISATWGAHEGSLVLWVFCLGLWTVAVAWFSRHLADVFAARVIGVLGLLSVGFLLFILMTSSPFKPHYFDQFNFAQEFFPKLTQVIKAKPDADFMTTVTKYELTAEKPTPNMFYHGGTGAALQSALKRYQLGPYFVVKTYYHRENDGKDLNPLLQDFGLAVHPPILYMGYVGFAVAFSFAIAALLSGKLDSAWARWSRPWTTLAWVFMTLGIGLGSWWAYYELGWGGWWFWDPVENASFMPWLIGTALIHSLAVTEKRGAYQTWTLMLALLAFSHSLLGTFLVRSGVLNSVHAFATDPVRGAFILGYLSVVVGGSLVLYVMRAETIKAVGHFSSFSREGLLLINNIFFVTASVAVLIGTLYPIIYAALGYGSMSIGAPLFNLVFAILMLPMAVIMAIGPLTKWKRQDPDELLRRVAPYAAISITISIVLALSFSEIRPSFTNFSCGINLGVSGDRWVVEILRMFGCSFDWLLISSKLIMSFVIAISIWIVLCTADILIHRRQRLGSWRATLSALKAGTMGMMLAHTGLAVFMIGACFASFNTLKEEIRMVPGESYTLNNHAYKLADVRWVSGPNYNAYEARFDVYRNTEKQAELFAQKRIYHAQKRGMTEAGIDGGFTRDLFVSLGDPLTQNVANALQTDAKQITPEFVAGINQALKTAPWSVSLQYKPFVRWIWMGALMMAFGGLISMLDKRYRYARAKVGSQQPVGVVALKPQSERS